MTHNVSSSGDNNKFNTDIYTDDARVIDYNVYNNNDSLGGGNMMTGSIGSMIGSSTVGYPYLPMDRKIDEVEEISTKRLEGLSFESSNPNLEDEQF